MTDYAIFRFEKVKTLSELGRRSRHNNRTSPQGLEHTDPQGDVSLLLGEDDAVSAWHAKAEAVGLDQAKLRKDATHAIEWVASASPSWWAGATDEEKAEWRTATLAHIVKKAGGAENVLSAHLHEDESTPHIQALTIPLKQKEVAKRGRAKRGAERATETVWTLTARDYIGGHRDVAIEMQTEYAAEVSHLGIQRGIPRKETGARNIAPAKWRAMKATELDAQIRATMAAEAAATSALTKERKAADTLEMSQHEARRVITTADERAEALHIGFEAVDKGELVYRPAIDQRPDGLDVKRTKEASVLPPKGDPFTRFTASLRPYLNSLKGYARRLAGLTDREAQVEAAEAALRSRETALTGREAALTAKAEQVGNIAAVLDESPDLLKEAKRRLKSKSSQQNNRGTDR